MVGGGHRQSHDSDSEDQNCEVCKGTKITGTPCRRRIGEAVRRAVKLGDLITADHKVLNEGGESRNNTDIQSWCKI